MESGAPPSPSILNVRQSCSSPATNPAGARSGFTNNSSPRRIGASPFTWKNLRPRRRRDSEMGRNLNQTIAELPADRQARIDARYREMKDEVEGLRELRQIAGKAQSDIATALNIKQPSVSKIEKQADMYLSTLRSYVEAIGGELDLVVRLPKRPAMRLHRLGEVFSGPPKPASQPRVTRSSSAKK